MKNRDFKLLATLPDGYEYELIRLNNQPAVMGKNGQEIIGFFIKDDKLVPIHFETKRNKN